MPASKLLILSNGFYVFETPLKPQYGGSGVQQRTHTLAQKLPRIVRVFCRRPMYTHTHTHNNNGEEDAARGFQLKAHVSV